MVLRILANDFGQNHGYTLFEWESPTNYTLTSWEKFYGTDGHVEFRRDLDRFLKYNRGTTFLGERFLFIKDFASRDKIDYTPCEYIGIAKLYCGMNVISQEWQNSAQACGKTAFWGDCKEGNDKIRRVGLWQPGKRHAMDSLRHLLYYFSFELGNGFFIQQLREA